MELKVGDKLYHKIIRRHYYDGEQVEIVVSEIVKVGRVYYTLRSGRKIYKQTLMYIDKIYSQNNVQYFSSKESLSKHIEVSELKAKLRSRNFHTFVQRLNEEDLNLLKDLFDKYDS